MAKINVTPSEFSSIVICFLLDKMLHPDDVVPFDKDFNKYMEKMIGKGMKPLTLNEYLKMDSNLRVYYKRIKKIFSGDANSGMIIHIWPSKKEEEAEKKKDGIIKRAIKKLLKRESINKEETNLLLEVLDDEQNRGED